MNPPWDSHGYEVIATSFSHSRYIKWRVARTLPWHLILWAIKAPITDDKVLYCGRLELISVGDLISGEKDLYTLLRE